MSKAIITLLTLSIFLQSCGKMAGTTPDMEDSKKQFQINSTAYPTK